MKTKLGILSELLALLIDTVFSYFVSQIVAGTLAYFYYMPPINGFLITWLSYYIVC